jgi:competence protein ComEC
MINWNSIPFTKLIVPFILGIVVYRYSEFDFPYLIYIGFFFFLILCLVLSYSCYVKRWVFGALTFIFIFLMSVANSEISLVQNRSNFFAPLISDSSIYLLKVLETAEAKQNSVQTFAQVLSFDGSSVSGKIQLRFAGHKKRIEKGSLILTSKSPREIERPKNPYQFNYKNYLAMKGVSHSLYLNSSQFVLVGRDISYLASKLEKIRSYLISVLKFSDLDDEQMAFASAILLGDRSFLSRELKSSFSKTGTMHILAVSGLHVGIVYLLFNFLFFVKSNAWLPFKLVLLLVVLWFYAALCGFSVSVVRAVVILSFISLAQYLNRSSNSINAISFSAFLLLLYNPYYLFDVGFQLSFVAVTSIVLIFPKIESIYKPRFWLVKLVWQTLCLSFVAQLATFGLSVYYFHQFPNYFLLSNLILFPVVPIILCAGLLFFVFHSITFISEPLFFVFKKCIVFF